MNRLTRIADKCGTDKGSINDAHLYTEFYQQFFEKYEFPKILEYWGKNTIVIVTHSLEQVKKLCTRAIWIKDGKVELDGSPNEVVEKYIEVCG